MELGFQTRNLEMNLCILHHDLSYIINEPYKKDLQIFLKETNGKETIKQYTQLKTADVEVGSVETPYE